MAARGEKEAYLNCLIEYVLGQLFVCHTIVPERGWDGSRVCPRLYDRGGS